MRDAVQKGTDYRRRQEIEGRKKTKISEESSLKNFENILGNFLLNEHLEKNLHDSANYNQHLYNFFILSSYCSNFSSMPMTSQRSHTLAVHTHTLGVY